MKSHGSFLVRCWRRDAGAERIEIEHIQTGEKALVTSLSEAAEWMSCKSAEHAASSVAGDMPAKEISDTS